MRWLVSTRFDKEIGARLQPCKELVLGPRMMGTTPKPVKESEQSTPMERHVVTVSAKISEVPLTASAVN